MFLSLNSNLHRLQDLKIVAYHTSDLEMRVLLIVNSIVLTIVNLGINCYGVTLIGYF